MPMTNLQKQCLLTFLGYDTGGIGNGWGAKSRNAVEACQEDLNIPADGVWGPQTEAAVLEAVYTYDDAIAEPEATGDPWDEIEYFSKKEFKCKCGGRYCDGYPAEIDMQMVRYADEIRRRIGKPLGVNSGLRCPQHNRNEGGVDGSEHTQGNAVDLGKPDGVTPMEMAEIAEEVMGNTGGIGIYYWGIHIDTRAGKSRWNG